MIYTGETETLTNVSLKTMSNEKVIEINNLRKSFASQEVLKNTSLNLFDGENLVVLGKSGSGKSVLIKCIVRLLNPAASSRFKLHKSPGLASGNRPCWLISSIMNLSKNRVGRRAGCS